MTLRQEESGWYAVVEAGASRRTLPVAESCAQAADAAALVVAIALDPTAVESSESAEPVPEPEPEPKPPPPLPTLPQPSPGAEPEPAPDAPASTAPPRAAPREPQGGRSGVTGHTSLAGGVGWGVVEQITAAVVAQAGVGWTRARAFIDATFTPPRTVDVDASSVRFIHWAVGVGGCGRFGLAARWSLEPCGAIELGQLLARPRGLDASSNATETWAAVRAGPHVLWWASRFVGLRIGAEALVPILRPSFNVGGAGRVAQPGPIGVRATAGLEIRFGSTL